MNMEAEKTIELEKTMKALKRFGLTEYESNAYAILVVKGLMAPREISDVTDIPYTRLYSVLKDLEKKGWVESQPGRPIVYKAVRPKFAARNAIQEILRELQQAEEIITQNLDDIYSKTLPVSRQVWVVKGKINVVNKILEMLDNARERVKIATPFIYFGRQEDSKFESIRQKIHSYEVHTQIIGKEITADTPDDYTKSLDSVPNHIIIRLHEGFHSWMVVVDGNEVLVSSSPYAEKLDLSEIIGIWTNDSGIVSTIENMFDLFWDESTSMREDKLD